MSRSEEIVTAIVFGFFTGLFVGFLIVSAQYEVWMREAIEAGVGQYNPESGVFEWRATPEKEGRE